MGKIDLWKVRDDIERDGGATYGADGAKMLLARGYAVSLDHVGKVFKNVWQMTQTALNEMARRARRYHGYVGFWRDEKTGLIYVDVSVIYADEKTAARVARFNRQLAYYDIARGASVYLS